jgi:hypothetical protein
MRWKTLGAAAALALASLSPSAAAARSSSAPQYLELSLHANYLTMSGDHWETTGAFTDSGVILADPVHDYRGNPERVWNALEVVLVLQGADGTLTFSYTRHWTPFPTAGFAASETQSGGAWRLIGGTGAYAGISGAGTFEGVFHYETGDFDEVFSGYVKLPG